MAFEIAALYHEAEAVNILTAQKVFASKNEIQRIFQQGGAKTNDAAISDIERFSLQDGDILRLGKKKLFRIKQI